jgi:threonine dehydratase
MDTVTEQHLDFDAAYQRLKDVVRRTPLEYNERLSAKYECEIYLKREDLQIVRSYKLRGAYNMISRLSLSNWAVAWYAPVRATMRRA